jgi:transcriptional regulator with XRE-family HTH domain
MTLGEKLKKLRTDNGLTQDELAEKIYVTRTAISKWETDKGYPSIESLKAIASFFSITVDELLSSEEILAIAKENQKQTEKDFCDLAFGLLDICMSLLLFLPLFATNIDDGIREVSLLSIGGISLYLKIYSLMDISKPHIRRQQRCSLCA